MFNRVGVCNAGILNERTNQVGKVLARYSVTIASKFPATGKEYSTIRQHIFDIIQNGKTTILEIVKDFVSQLKTKPKFIG